MTRNEVLAMLEGRDLDALVAKNVLEEPFIVLPNRNQYGLCDWCGRAQPDDHLKRNKERGTCWGQCEFSYAISAAWRVVSKMADAHDVIITSEPTEDGRIGWLVSFQPWGCAVTVEPAFSESAPLAICRAALLCSVAYPATESEAT